MNGWGVATLTLLGIFFFILILYWGAVYSRTPDFQDITRCVTQNDCLDNESCENGICNEIITCESNEDCFNNQTCIKDGEIGICG